MSSVTLTDERLRSRLNADQASRERMCIAVLGLDRNYSDIKPRRPEGGPDGGRDIECHRNGLLCFGAVGFQNNVSDSPDDKRNTAKKFESDVDAARAASAEAKAFVFFCNTDMTPTEVKDLSNFAISKGFSLVDIFYRERIRIALDGVEGLAVRFQYLDIAMSDTEQKAFFGRFGKDLEGLIHGRFDQIEKKLDELRFEQWRAGPIHRIELELKFKRYAYSKDLPREHFRVAVDFRDGIDPTGSMVLGCRDDYVTTGDGITQFASKSFFGRESKKQTKGVWLPHGSVRMFGGAITGITSGVTWSPHSTIQVREFDRLSATIHFTRNLVPLVDRVRLSIDHYVFVDWRIDVTQLERWSIGFEWPDELTAEELAIETCGIHPWLRFEELPKSIDYDN